MICPALDFRSDTATKPTPAMREAMARAEVGDDVWREDPTVNRLQERVAELLGKEAAIFVPSGTMSNQIGVRLHCKSGDEFLCEANCHIYNYEQGAFAQLSGVVARCIEGKFGVLEREQLVDMIRPDNQHFVRTRLLCLENTHNRGGGRAWPYETLAAVCEQAHEQGLKTHLDGARLWNAAIATGIPLARWAQHFDTVSVCFSKGLGAPIGSALVGPRAMIDEAERHRKVFGGGMRQAGVIAAAALHAVEHHIDRLADDHRRAQSLAASIRQIDGLTLRPEKVDTNLVIFRVDAKHGSASEFAGKLKARGLLVGAFGRDYVRMVTHLDVDDTDVEQAVTILRDVCESGAVRPAVAAKSAYA